jgi:hypothetical protein
VDSSRDGTIVPTFTCVVVCSGSVVMTNAGAERCGTVCGSRRRGAVGVGIAANRARMRASTSAGSKSPTAMTAIRSGRYQSL